MRRFVLDRAVDETGVSGTGTVCEGVQFSDGKVALRWIVGDHRSTVMWDDIDSVLAIHGHNGATTLRWIDQPPVPIRMDAMPIEEFEQRIAEVYSRG